MNTNEFQIIPKYFLDDNFLPSLIEQLRIFKFKRVYCIVQNKMSIQPFLNLFEQNCTKFEIAIHYEYINDNFVLSEESFFKLKNNLKIGRPDVLVVFGAEKAINFAKLINYLISNSELNDLNELINNLKNEVDLPLKMYCILNDFTLGSENNFVGVLNTFANNTYQRIAFNANTISSFIYAHQTFFNDLNDNKINLNIFSMFIRSLEQILGSKTFEYSKNFAICNIQTLINYLDSKNPNKDKDELNNLIWTNLMINSGLPELLNDGDWKLHILAFELVDYLQISIQEALLLVSISYFMRRIEKDPIYQNMFNEIAFTLFGQRNFHLIISYLVNLKKAIHFELNLKLNDEEIQTLSNKAIATIKTISLLNEAQINELKTLFQFVLEANLK